MSAFGYHKETTEIIKALRLKVQELEEELSLVKSQRNASNRKIEELQDTLYELKVKERDASTSN